MNLSLKFDSLMVTRVLTSKILYIVFSVTEYSIRAILFLNFNFSILNEFYNICLFVVCFFFAFRLFKW